MTDIGEDKVNPFARPSPWPSLPSAPMRLSVPRPSAATPAPQPDPEPPPAAVPRFIVVDTPVFARAPAPAHGALTDAPVTAGSPPQQLVAEPPEPSLTLGSAQPDDVAPVETPRPEPAAAAAAPLAQPILAAHRAKPRRRSIPLAPLAGAAIAGAGAVGALFVL